MNELINEIRTKIDNNNPNLTEQEKELIAENEELSTYLLAKLSTADALWNENMLNFVHDYLLEDIDPTEDLLFMLFKYYVIYSKNILENCLNEVCTMLSSPSHIAELKQLFKERAISGDMPVDCSYLLDLLEEQDYETIMAIKNISADVEKMKEVIPAFQKSFPIATYGFPTCLNNYAIKFIDKCDYMPIDALFILYYENDSRIDYTHILELLKANLHDKKCLSSITDFRNLTSFVTKLPPVFAAHLTDEERIQIFNILWENGIYVSNSDMTNQLAEHPESAITIINNMSTNKQSYDSVVAAIKMDNGERDFLRPLFYSSLKENKAILDYLFAKNEIKLFLELDNDNPQKPHYIDMIIRKLQEGNQDIIDYFNSNPYDININTEIAKTCLTVPAIKTIIYDDAIYGANTYLYEDFLEFLTKNRTTEVNVESINGVQINYETGIKFLESKRYRAFGYFLSSVIEGVNEDILVVPPELIDKMVSAIDEDPALADVISELAPYTYKGIVFNNPHLLYSLISASTTSAKNILEAIAHNDDMDIAYTEDLFNKFVPYLTSEYQINRENLNLLVSNYGYKILRYVDNENILELLKLPISDLSKIIALLPQEEFTLIDMDATYDAVKQYEFSLKNTSITEAFPTIVHSLDDKTEDYLPLIDAISKIMDDKFFNRFQDKYDFEEFRSHPKDLLELIIAKIKYQPDKREKYLDILHDITDYYILISRELYRTTYNMYEDLSIPYTNEPKSELNYLVAYTITHLEDDINNYKAELNRMPGVFGTYIPDELNHLKDTIIDEMQKRGVSPSITIDILKFLSNPHASLNNDLKTIYKNIKVAKTVIKSIVEFHKDFIMKMLEGSEYYQDFQKNVKKNYYLEQQPLDMYQLLSLLRIDILKEKLLPNSKLYQSLLANTKRRKLHLLPESIKNFINSSNLDINISPNTSVTFINYFYKIYENQVNIEQMRTGNFTSDKPILLTLPSILRESSFFLSVSSAYSQILGTEDTALIMANSGPNNATKKTKNNERLNEAVEWTLKNYLRQELTVPPINEEITINDKKMRCIVGNFTNPCNITHGERTGACMRIGGVGESLFNFALENPNGFHIRFEDPETGKYISRVTGFRNGNSVFLNELRNSCDPDKYTNEDLVSFCRQVGNLLIAQSKNSSCPIENIIIHRAYATSEMPEKEVNLGILSVKEGLPHFYSDINTHAIVLASTNPDNKLVKINLDKRKVPTYLPAREQSIKTTNYEELLPFINRIHAVKIYNETRELSKIEPISLDTGFVFGMANHDWFIYLDMSGQIHEGLLPFDARAEQELESARQIILASYEHLSIHQENNETKEQGSGTYGL